MDPTLHQPDEMANYLGFLMHRRRVESSATLLEHFGFQEDPFKVSPDPRYMYPSQTHLEALAALENGFYNDRGFIAMIAPPGMGKTTLLYRFLEDTQATARSVFLFDIDAECKPRDFVGYILRDFGITPAPSSSEMHKQLGEALIEETQAGRKCVVVIDEAQNLSDAVLERVRLLTNFETSKGKLLQIILSGQPQLTDKLLQASLVQLRQRVSTVCRLELLSQEETIGYIDYRLKLAGYSGDPLFTEDALLLIAEKGGGTPRTINNLCFNALSLCNARRSKQVDSGMVERVAANLQLVSQPGESVALGANGAVQPPGVRERWKQLLRALRHWGKLTIGQVWFWVPATAAVLVLCVLGVLRLSGVGDSEPRKTSDERPLNVPVANQAVPAPTAVKTRKSVAAKPTSKTKPSDLGYAVGSHVPATLPRTSVEERSRASAAAASQAALGRSPAQSLQGGSPAEAQAPAQAVLSVDSIPVGADIEIDGAFVGSTPSTVTIAAGNHRITVNRKGYGPWSKTLSVSGGTVHLNAELEQEPAK